jgi:hypothetical protein
LSRGADKHHGSCQQTPTDHDPREPRARPEPHQQKIRGHFEQRVAKKKQPCAQTVDRGTEVQVAVHLGCGEADVGAIYIRDQVAEAEQRKDAPTRLTDS